MKAAAYFLIAAFAAGCIERFPDSAYASSGQIGVTENDTVSGSTDVGSGSTDSGSTGNDSGPTLNLGIYAACAKEKCQATIANCASKSACVTALGCIGTCSQKDGQCMSSCFQPFSSDLGAAKAFSELLDCTQVKCESCGNGVCGSYETGNGCPSDCAVPSNAFTACLSSQCSSVYQACNNDAGCTAAMRCAYQCVTTECLNGCAPISNDSNSIYQPLVSCAFNFCGS